MAIRKIVRHVSVPISEELKQRIREAMERLDLDHAPLNRQILYLVKEGLRCPGGFPLPSLN